MLLHSKESLHLSSATASDFLRLVKIKWEGCWKTRWQQGPIMGQLNDFLQHHLPPKSSQLSLSQKSPARILGGGSPTVSYHDRLMQYEILRN